MSNKMNGFLDFIGMGNLGLGLILGVQAWINSVNYPLMINILTVLSLLIGLIYVSLKVVKMLKDWKK